MLYIKSNTNSLDNFSEIVQNTRTWRVSNSEYKLQTRQAYNKHLTTLIQKILKLSLTSEWIDVRNIFPFLKFILIVATWLKQDSAKLTKIYRQYFNIYFNIYGARTPILRWLWFKIYYNTNIYNSTKLCANTCRPK